MSGPAAAPPAPPRPAPPPDPPPDPPRPARPRPGRRTRPWLRAGRSDARGAVTAELAVGLPLLLAVTAGLTWLVAVAINQTRTVDAARETARALARGDDQGAAVAAGERVAPDGVRISVTRSGREVHVRANGRLAGPGGLLAALPGAELDAEAVALTEEGVEEGAVDRLVEGAAPGAGP